MSDTAVLWSCRRVINRSGAAALDRLGRLDARIAAHLDGRMVAGPAGFKLLLASATCCVLHFL